MWSNEALNIVVSLGVLIGYVFLHKPARALLSGKAERIEQGDQRVVFFDAARGLAILAVIIIHVTFFFPLFADAFPASINILNEQINRVFRFAIAFFLLSSGALLWIKDLKAETLGRFYGRKIMRIFIPYAFFSFLLTSINHGGDAGVIKAALLDLLTGRASVPYYYLIVLAQLYLLYPLLWHLLYGKRMGKQWFVLGAIVLTLVGYFWIPLIGSFPFFLQYLAFFAIGMILRPVLLQQDARSLRGLRLGWPMVVLSILYFGIGALDPTLRYYNVHVAYGVVLFVGVFMLLRRPAWSVITRVLAHFGRVSLWIYLSHFLIMEVFIALLYQLNRVTSYGIYVFLTLAFTIPASYLVARIVCHFYRPILMLFARKTP